MTGDPTPGKPFGDFFIGAHHTSEARKFLGLDWIKPSVPYSILAHRGDHYIQVNHDCTGYNVCHPNGMSYTIKTLEKAFEYLKEKVP